MHTFRIRDLMVSLRPGLATPKRLKTFLDCDITEICDGDSGGGDCGETCACSDTCGDSCGACTDTCGDTCAASCGACTDTCGASCGACTDTCGATCGASCGDSCGCSYCSGGCSNCTATCHGVSECGITLCGGGCTMSVDQPTPLQFTPVIATMQAGGLAQLKNQLRSVMQQVNRRENAIAVARERYARVPRTVSQVDALEKLLSAALADLRARRAELEKAAPKKAAAPAQKSGKKTR